MGDPGRPEPFARLHGLSPPMEPTPAPQVWLPLFLAWRLLGLAADAARSLAFMALITGGLVLLSGAVRPMEGRDWVAIGRSLAAAVAAWAISVAPRTCDERISRSDASL